MASSREVERERDRTPSGTHRSLSASPSSPTRTGRTPGDRLRDSTEAARRFQQTALENMVVQQGEMMRQQQDALQQIVTKLSEVSSDMQQRDPELAAIRRQLDEARANPMFPPGLNNPGGQASGNGQGDPFTTSDPSGVSVANGQGSQQATLLVLEWLVQIHS